MRARALYGPDFSGTSSARPAWHQFRPGTARSKNKIFGLSPAQPETKYKILAQAQPGQFFFPISARSA